MTIIFLTRFSIKVLFALVPGISGLPVLPSVPLRPRRPREPGVPVLPRGPGSPGAPAGPVGPYQARNNSVIATHVHSRYTLFRSTPASMGAPSQDNRNKFY